MICEPQHAKRIVGLTIAFGNRCAAFCTRKSIEGVVESFIGCFDDGELCCVSVSTGEDAHCVRNVSGVEPFVWVLLIGDQTHVFAVDDATLAD